MIGSINLRQARFLSDAYEADSLDSIEDYQNDSGSSLGFPPGSYPDSCVITLHKLLLRQLNMSILLCSISDLVMFEIALYMGRSLQKSSHE
jgi:hypothetical protein